MGSKRGQQKKRAKKKGPPVQPKAPRAASSKGRRNDLADSGMTMTWEWGDMSFMFKLTEAQENLADDTVTVSAVPVEETIHPHPLNFPPPLQELATSDSNGFERHWEKLTYAFDLPDPNDFPELPLDDDDRKVLRRFIVQCRHLAGYSAIAGAAGLHISSKGQGDWQVEAELPNRETFGGTSVAFRQLHNQSDEASFSKVKARLFKATGQLSQEEQKLARATMSLWVDARGKLMNHLLPTVVCKKVSSNAPAGHPISFRDINPEELLGTFNYGDTLHWGEHKEKLVNLTSDPHHEAYYRYALVETIVALSHLYFGWSLLVQAALGDEP